MSGEKVLVNCGVPTPVESSDAKRPKASDTQLRAEIEKEFFDGHRLTKLISPEDASVAVYNKINVQASAIKSYLEQSVVPIVQDALECCALERPADPFDFIAKYLRRHNPMRHQNVTNSTGSVAKDRP